MGKMKYICSMIAVFLSIGLLYETLGMSGKTTNLFVASVSILYPWKYQKTSFYSGVFKGYKMGILARNGLTYFVPTFSLTHFMPLVSF